MFNEYVIQRFERGATIYTKIANGTMDKRRCESCIILNNKIKFT